MTPNPAEIKACCAASYGQDAVALVLGESYRPGGLALTRRLAGALGLRPGQRVVDVASGPGSTARLLAAEFGVAVDGVDLGESMVERARSATEQAGLSRSVRFHLGDAERIPLPDAIADARPVTQYTDIVAAAGLATLHVEAHDDALARMIEQIEARLIGYRMFVLRLNPQAGRGIRFTDLGKRTT